MRIAENLTKLNLSVYVKGTRYIQRILFFVILSGMVISCSPKGQLLPDSKVDELRTNFIETVREADSSFKIDSFKLVRIDTLTMVDKYWTISVQLTADITRKTDEAKSLLKEFSNLVDLTNLSNGISERLYSQYKADANEKQAEGLSVLEEAKQLTSKRDSFSVLSRTADSVNPVAFSAVCFYQVRRKDQSVIKDTTYIILNTDRNIIKMTDYLGDY